MEGPGHQKKPKKAQKSPKKPTEMSASWKGWAVQKVQIGITTEKPL
jgi:hypothetical protein